MDPVSLLSELYGEGLDTVLRFKENGLVTLEDICSQKSRTLARMLKVSDRCAKSILAEARELMQGSLFEPEMRLLQTPKPAVPSGIEQSTPSPQDFSTPDFKMGVLDLVVKQFR